MVLHLVFPLELYKHHDNRNPISQVQSHNSQLWYPDPGATHRVTNNAENLLNVMPLSGTDQILLGNDQGLAITSIDLSKFNFPLKPNTSLALKNLLLVSDITKNLISVRQIARSTQARTVCVYYVAPQARASTS